jgi:hypothetical protein
MAYASAGREAVLGAEARRYERHCPEQTLLYQPELGRGCRA